MHEGAGTHQTRLDRDVDGGTRQSVVADRAGRLSKRHDLGMRRRVDTVNRLVTAASDDGTPEYNDGADRHLVKVQRAARLNDRFSHALFVVRAVCLSHRNRSPIS
jgi:hypothetical protein